MDAFYFILDGTVEVETSRRWASSQPDVPTLSAAARLEYRTLAEPMTEGPSSPTSEAASDSEGCVTCIESIESKQDGFHAPMPLCARCRTFCLDYMRWQIVIVI